MLRDITIHGYTIAVQRSSLGSGKVVATCSTILPNTEEKIVFTVWAFGKAAQAIHEGSHYLFSGQLRVGENSSDGFIVDGASGTPIGEALSFCRVSLSGFLARDFEVKNFASGSTLAESSMAVNHKKDSPPLWLSLNYWGYEAERASGSFSKGDPFEASGSLKLNTYQTKDGVEHSKWILEGRTWSYPPKSLKSKTEPAPKSTGYYEDF